MKKDRRSLKRRMLWMLALSFAPMLIGITLLFAETLASEQRAEVEMLHYTAMEINETLENYASGIYSVSDGFSSDERLVSVIDKDYTDNPLEKQRVIVFILNTLFESYNRILQQEKMAAVYVVPKHELFDFIDPNQDAAFVVQQLDRLDVNNKDRLGRFYWHSLEENFLTTTSYGEARRDHVIVGSRRVYSALRSGYPYIHIFAIEEKKLYDLYRLEAEKLAAEVYILNDRDGGLVSSTDEAAVAACEVPEAIAALAASMQSEDETRDYKGEPYNVTCIRSELSGWTTLILVPCSRVTAATRTLYLKILTITILCVTLCCVLLLAIYRQFMQPLSQLEAAMHRADTGDLKAYVKPQGQTEMVRMMETYNYMLDGIRTGMEERMRLERLQQDLEMQVLMSQINPHFLYNTLESIVWKARSAGQPDIGKLASSLGKLYRLSISGGLFVTLKQELEHVQMYMNIQQSRYSEVAYEVELNGLDPAGVETLKLILQPVVENCLLYGMDGLDRSLRIRICACREGERLVLTVTDNGVGMDEAALERLRVQIAQGRKEDGAQKNRRSTGIGLHNIDARLKLYAGPESGLTVRSTPGVGTEVTLTLPYRAVAKE